MSRELIESIVSNNMLEANDMVEVKMAEIRERKMYEMKRMYASEAFGGLTKQDIEDRKKAGYKKASDVLADPRDEQKKSKRINPGAKILKKKVSESVEVQPDPEGRIRGGEPKKKESRFSRAREKIIKKGEEIGGNIAAGVVGKAFDVAHGMAAARKLRKLRKQRKERDAARAAEKTAKTTDTSKKDTSKKTRKAAPDVTPSEPSFPKHDTPSYKRPGMLKRNINTLMGREPGHVDDRSPEEKLRSKGGRVGKLVRKVAASDVVSDLRSIGSKHL